VAAALVVAALVVAVLFLDALVVAALLGAIGVFLRLIVSYRPFTRRLCAAMRSREPDNGIQ
jgi:uncharacterized YccA/Bax inhibitor family protein